MSVPAALAFSMYLLWTLSDPARDLNQGEVTRETPIGDR